MDGDKDEKDETTYGKGTSTCALAKATGDERAAGGAWQETGGAVGERGERNGQARTGAVSSGSSRHAIGLWSRVRGRRSRAAQHPRQPVVLAAETETV